MAPTMASFLKGVESSVGGQVASLSKNMRGFPVFTSTNVKQQIVVADAYFTGISSTLNETDARLVRKFNCGHRSRTTGCFEACGSIHAAGSGCPQQSVPKYESRINRSPTPTTPSSLRSAGQPVVQPNCASRSNMSITETDKSPLTSPGQSQGSQLPSS